MSQIRGFDSVVDADTLRPHLSDPSWRIIDCRFDLLHPDAGEQAYRAGHIGGAVLARLDRDLSAPPDAAAGRHPLPEAAQLAERFARWGIEPSMQIIAYDAQAGQFAARLWWLARWLGHRKVALLDGGWQAALKAGLKVEGAEPTIAATRFERGTSLVQIADTCLVEAARTDHSWRVVDARAPERYAGLNETLDPVAGHIPGAVNRFWQSNLQADGRFKSAEQLSVEFGQLLAGRPAAQLIAQCGSGVTACHHLVAMQRAQLPGALLYPGSWSAWISDRSRPVATGSEPG